MKEFRITLRARNNLLISRREELGLKPSEIAERMGVSYNTYLRYEGLNASPLRLRVPEGESPWKQSALKIADYFKVLPEDLWPPPVRGIKCPIVEREYDAEAVLALTSSSTRLSSRSPQLLVEHLDLRNQMNAVLETLTPREQEVLRVRYVEDESFAVAAARIGVTTERARQIEIKALRKLRGPSRSAYLKEFVVEKHDGERLREAYTIMVWTGGSWERSRWWASLSQEKRYRHRRAWEHSQEGSAKVYDSVVWRSDTPEPPEVPGVACKCSNCGIAAPEGADAFEARSLARDAGFVNVWNYPESPCQCSDCYNQLRDTLESAFAAKYDDASVP